jgi:hypothetical protein
MTKIVGEPIRVHEKQNENSPVAAFIWRKRLYRVDEVLNWWREPADWWTGNPMRFFVMVNATCSSTCTFELYKFGDSWFLSRILD